MEEIWKDVVCYEGYYEVSNFGRIRTAPHSRKGIQGEYIQKSIIRKPYLSKIGYPVLNLSKDGVIKTKYIHRLVAEAFIDNPQNLPVVNHKDGNKENNNVSNLEWVTQRNNILHRFKTLGQPLPKENIYVEFDGEKISVSDLARKFNLSRHTIYNRVIKCGWSVEKAISIPERGKTI